MVFLCLLQLLAQTGAKSYLLQMKSLSPELVFRDSIEFSDCADTNPNWPPLVQKLGGPADPLSFNNFPHGGLQLTSFGPKMCLTGDTNWPFRCLDADDDVADESKAKMLVLALKCCFCNDDISSDDYITKGSRCLFTSTILIARKATPQRFLSTNIQFQTNLKFGNKFSASYEASKFCWQIAPCSPQHLRPYPINKYSISNDNEYHQVALGTHNMVYFATDSFAVSR